MDLRSFARSAAKLIDTIWIHKGSCIGMVGCYYLSRRMNSNMVELERNTQDKKLFDPIKAKAQIEVYKEIYRMEEQENLPEDQRKDVRK